MPGPDIATLAGAVFGGGVTGYVSAITVSRVHRARQDMRLTRLETQMRAALRMLAALGNQMGAPAALVMLVDDLANTTL